MGFMNAYFDLIIFVVELSSTVGQTLSRIFIPPKSCVGLLFEGQASVLAEGIEKAP